jgi:hypothetical protein
VAGGLTATEPTTRCVTKDELPTTMRDGRVRVRGPEVFGGRDQFFGDQSLAPVTAPGVSAAMLGM